MHDVIEIQSSRYPKLLREIASPPKKLWVRGTLVMDEPTVAIVGTRKPSRYGIEAAEYFSRELALQGITIVSGLAFGIDKAAHEACLESGGRTIAVLASGVDAVTPTSHRHLGERISKQGAIVSEFPPGTDARPEQFPQRNRIISGLSLGVVIVEAPERSGALITARFAAEQGREVFVVPGEIFSPNYLGSHALIQEGAKLVKTADDVLEELNLLTPTPKFTISDRDETLPAEAKRIIGALREHNGLSTDELTEMLGISAHELGTNLTILELRRYIRKNQGFIYLIDR